MGKGRSRGRPDVHPEGRLRDEILGQLQRVDGGAWVARMAPGAPFSHDDRRRITEFVGGITRKRRWLDFLIDSFSSRNREVDPIVRQILRIGIYELAELDRAPHASVFASVEQTKRHAPRGVGKFVNGVLRSVARRLNELPCPDTGDEVVDAAIVASHPDWMAGRWSARFGLDAAKALMDYNNRRPVHSLRVNSLKTTVDDFKRSLDALEVAWEESPYLPEFLRITRLQPVIGAGLLSSGLAAVQDESAGLVGRVVNPAPGEVLIDACAAPGGKLIHAGLQMKNEGRLIGVDANRKRLGEALKAADAHGLSIVETIVADFREPTPSASLPIADGVILDAPCSGLGVLSRRADLRWRRTEESITELTHLQDELLDAAVKFVRPGGRLIYATCTIEPEENEQRVEAFLQRHGDFELEPATEDLPGSVEDNGFLATLPHVHQIDGAFAARLVRSR